MITKNRQLEHLTIHAENLSSELWIEIFDYLQVYDMFDAFFNLNKFFNDLLMSKYLLFKIELNASHNDATGRLPNRYATVSILNRIICLKSSIKSSYDYFPQFFLNYGRHLTQLQSLLIKANTNELPSICLALQQLSTLQYLSLSCIPNQQLLQCILTSPSLRQCRLHFWRLTTSIDANLDINRNIEILSIKLNDDANHSIMNLLLSHMPNLKKLEIIEENCVNNSSHPLLHQQLFVCSNLETLKLKWGYHVIQSNCLKYLFIVTPNLKHLRLHMFYCKLDQILNGNLINYLFSIVEQMKYITIHLLCHQLKNSNEDNLPKMYENYCQRIVQTINIREDQHVEAKWYTKNLKTQKIEICLKIL